MWIVIFAALIIFGTTCSIATSAYGNPNRNLIDDLFICFEILCNQNGNEEMRSVSLRTSCLAISLAAIIVFSSYGATITSFLTVESFDRPFTNIEEFLKNGKYKLLIESGDMMLLNQERVNIWILV